MLYNELEQGDILSGVRWRLALLAYTDILLCSIGAMRRIRQTPVTLISRKRVDDTAYGPCGSQDAGASVKNFSDS